MKPLPHGVCQKLLKLMPTRSSCHVEQLCFLVRRNPTVRLPGVLKRRYSLFKRKNHKMSTASPFSLSRILFLCFYSFLCFSFLFFISLLILFHFLLIFSFIFAFLSSFWSIDRMGQKEEVSFPPSSSQMCGFPFSYLYSLFLYFLYDIIPYMA